MRQSVTQSAALFDPNAHATPLLERLLAEPPPRSRYVIYFTPRSGSSWLTGIVEQSAHLGCAQEVFNPVFCQLHAQDKGICSLEQYIDMVQRRDNRGGVFSFEITAHQMQETFSDTDVFRRHFATDPAFWLIRQDIVAQAVSLAKMVATDVGQSVASNTEQRAAADMAFTYDARAIKEWLMHILAAERMCEAWFAQWGLRPLRLSYEQITTLTPHQVLNVIARHAGLPDVPPVDFQPRHEKLGTTRNTEYALRFRREYAGWLASVEAERTQWLDKLDDVASLVSDL